MTLAYAQWWECAACTPEWYARIHQERAVVHGLFLTRVGAIENEVDVSSVLEVGGGMNTCYPFRFQKYRYVGCDISKRATNWNKANLPGEFWCGDVTEMKVAEKFDLVFSHAVVDHVPDIPRFLLSLSRWASRVLMVTSYSGWFVDLSDHQYTWSDSQQCFYNKMAPELARVLLCDDGWAPVVAEPIPGPGGKVETLLTARR